MIYRCHKCGFRYLTGGACPNHACDGADMVAEGAVESTMGLRGDLPPVPDEE